MSKRLIDADALGTSEELLQVNPPRYRAEYASLVSLALVNGSFKCDAREIWKGMYSSNRPDFTLEDVIALLDEFESRKLLFRWQHKDGRTYGYFVGIEKPGILPAFRRLKRLSIGPLPPHEDYLKFLGVKESEVLWRFPFGCPTDLGNRKLLLAASTPPHRRLSNRPHDDAAIEISAKDLRIRVPNADIEIEARPADEPADEPVDESALEGPSPARCADEPALAVAPLVPVPLEATQDAAPEPPQVAEHKKPVRKLPRRPVKPFEVPSLAFVSSYMQECGLEEKVALFTAQHYFGYWNEPDRNWTMRAGTKHAKKIRNVRLSIRTWLRNQEFYKRSNGRSRNEDIRKRLEREAALSA